MSIRRISATLAVIALGAIAPVATAGEAMAVGWDAAKLATWPSPVPHQAIVVDGQTDIRWMPEAFAFTPGPSRRYIDYAAGDDARDGLTPATAWKHHPWDAAAGGTAATGGGQHTYVFKRGVVYRGKLVGKESGTALQPVQLTSDPAWGSGEAVIAGSLAITGGWTKASAADSAAFPADSQGKLWSVALPGAQIPRGLWQVGKDGARQRLKLARWPNWTITHPYNHYTQWFRVESVEKGFPSTTIFAPKVLNDPDKNAFQGATVWMDHANTSGEFSIIGPFPAAAAGYSPAKGSLKILTNHPRRHPNANAPFYLENLPRFLDEAGEWWFDAKASRLWLRLPGEADPNTALIEAAQHDIILDLVHQQHVAVSGLTFTGGNCPDLNKAPGGGDWTRRQPITQMGAIRLRGNTQHIVLRHLAIRQTIGGGIVHDWTDTGERLQDIEIRDSRFADIDNDGIQLWRTVAESQSPLGTITDVRIWRNHLTDIGMRTSQQQGGIGIGLKQVQVADVAGNIVERVGKQGIDVVGDGGGGQDVPLVRIQIRHNKVVDTLMQRQDFGGIEFWGMGPCYIYGNISIDPVGFIAHRNVYHKNQAFYVDHGLKSYIFNNLGWSQPREDAYRGVMGDHFLHEIRNRWTQAFHNTGADFRSGQSHSMQHGDQQHYLANLFINCGSALSHWRHDQAAEVAFANNLIAGPYRQAFSRWKGESHRTMESLNARLAELPNQLSGQAGWVTDDLPVRDVAKRDFRLTDTSAAIDRGVQVFVPWALAGTVGEWHFRRHRRDPATVLGYDLYPQTFHGGTNNMQLPMPEDEKQAAETLPSNDLLAPGFTVDDYIDGPLEDWVPGAVRLDGSRHLSLPQAHLIREFSITRGKEKVVIPGTERKTVQMQTNNFLIEAVLRAEPGKAGTIAGKQAGGTGYALGLDAQGRPTMLVQRGGAAAQAMSPAPITDGRWHHVLAEVDRSAGTIRLHVDGASVGAATAGLPAADASLANDADFVVGQGLVGAIDYLRVARGTLADSQTSLAELLNWQFNGPALRDFTGRAPTGGIRDIGAIEHPTVSGRQTIRYTPPVIPPEELMQAADRTVKSVPWGAVSVPKELRPGMSCEVIVSFGTEAVAGTATLAVELHGWAKGTSLGAIASGKPVTVTAGVTAPYAVPLTVPARDGLTGYTVRVIATPAGGTDPQLTTDVGAMLGAGK